MSAALSTDGSFVVTDFGVYYLTGDELGDPGTAIANAEAKCRAAYDSGWYERKAWDERLTAQTVL